MTHAPTKHSRLGPSSSNRWLECPFSAQLDLPDERNEHSARGDKLHHQCAYVVKDGLPLFGDDPDTQAVRFCTDYTRQFLARDDCSVFVERTLESLTIPGFGGTIDVLALADDWIHVNDYKFGKWKVPAKNNTQMLCYLSLANEHFPGRHMFSATILQPAAYKKPNTAVYTLAEVEAHAARVREAGQSDKKVTGEHCRFCPLREMKACAEGVRYGRLRGW